MMYHLNVITHENGDKENKNHSMIATAKGPNGSSSFVSEGEEAAELYDIFFNSLKKGLLSKPFKLYESFEELRKAKQNEAETKKTEGPAEATCNCHEESLASSFDISKKLRNNKSIDFSPISAPKHYVEGRTYEPWKVIEDWDLGFCLGNALKYIARAGRKDDDLTDLLKAKQYIDFEIERIRNGKEK